MHCQSRPTASTKTRRFAQQTSLNITQRHCVDKVKLKQPFNSAIYRMLLLDTYSSQPWTSEGICHKQNCCFGVAGWDFAKSYNQTFPCVDFPAKDNLRSAHKQQHSPYCWHVLDSNWSAVHRGTSARHCPPRACERHSPSGIARGSRIWRSISRWGCSSTSGSCTLCRQEQEWMKDRAGRSHISKLWIRSSCSIIFECGSDSEVFLNFRIRLLFKLWKPALQPKTASWSKHSSFLLQALQTPATARLWELTTDPVFQKCLTLAPEKMQNPPGLDSGSTTTSHTNPKRENKTNAIPPHRLGSSAKIRFLTRFPTRDLRKYSHTHPLFSHASTCFSLNCSTFKETKAAVRQAL